jgi:hypothetical protein
MIANAVRELNIFEREPWRLTPQFALYLLSIAPASVGELATSPPMGFPTIA